MIQKLIFCLIAIQFTNQACSKGCLKCDDSMQCVICNQLQLKFVQNGICTESPVENCNIVNTLGECLHCKGDNYIDVATKKCTPVPTPIINCEEYSSANVCTKCSGNRFFENGKCSALITGSNLVDNCQRYKSQSSCSECNTGYYLDSSNECLKFPTGKNCYAFSRYNCTSCKSGYILNRNLAALTTTYDLTNNLQVDQAMFLVYMVSAGITILRDDFALCQLVTVENCMELEEFNKCKQCNEGYFLTFTNQCQVNPIDVIQNCEKYSDNYTCIKCSSNFILSSITGNVQQPNRCNAVTADAITNCSSYSTVSNSNICLECKQGFYLESSNSCKTRTAVTDCLTFAINADECSQCNSGKVLSNTKLHCVEQITDCLVHDITVDAQGTETKSCTTCVDTKMQSNDENIACIDGTIDNCQVYSGNAVCDTCQNTFYKAGEGVCTSNDVLPQCKTSFQDRKNLCLECNQGYFPFRIANSCASEVLLPISNCSTYDTPADQNTESVCTDCDPGYELSGNQCVSINLTQCQAKTNNDCTQCFSSQGSYYGLGKTLIDSVLSNDQCITPFDFQSQCNVMSNGTDSIYGFECDVCIDRAVGRSIADHNVCVHESKLTSLQNPINENDLIPNCISYNSAKNCLRCAQGWYTVLKQNSCVETCAKQIIPYRLAGVGIHVVEINRCVQINDDDILLSDAAEIQAYSIRDQSVRIDVTCRADYLPWIEDKEDNHWTNIQIGNGQDWFKDDKYFFVQAGVSCTDTNGVTYTGQGAQFDSKCKYYFSIIDQEYQCMRCDINYTSNKIQKISDTHYVLLNCQETLNDCKDSQQTAHRYQNVPPYWEQFYSCHKCQNDIEVPVLFGQFGVNIVPNFISHISYTIPELGSNDAWQNDINSQPVNRCMDNQNSDAMKLFFNFPAEKSLTHIANCGGYAMHIDSNTTRDVFDNSESSTNDANFDFETNMLFCTFCKPGFRPTFKQNSSSRVVTACTQILNCDPNSDAVNICSKCEASYFHHYDTDNDKVLYDQDCVSTNNQQDNQSNCLSLQKNVSNNTQCLVCKKGYYLNEDHICEQLSINKCSTWNQKPTFNGYHDENNMNLLIYFGFAGYGCSSCDSNYVGVIVDSSGDQNIADQNACFVSDFVTSNTDLVFPDKIWQEGGVTQPSSFIDKCLKYQINKSNGDFQCFECLTDFVISQDSKNCYPVESNKFCKIADNDVSCNECLPNYGLVWVNSDAKCILNNITNCIEVNVSQPQNMMICNTCATNYYLSATKDSCILGNVANCKVYQENKALNCQECEAGYMIFSSSEISSTQGIDGFPDVQRDYCFKIPTDLDCSPTQMILTTNQKVDNPPVIEELNIQYQTLQCNECKSPWLHAWPMTASVNDHQCLQYNEITNCDEYVISDLLNSTNFSCKLCTSATHFRTNNGNKCQERVNKPNSCAGYNQNADECVDCGSSAFINATKDQCMTNPAGYLGCQVYELPDDATQNTAPICKSCDPLYFLQSNTNCQAIVDELTGCEYYTSETECKSCSSQNILINTPAEGSSFTNSCQSTTVQNCLTFSGTSCVTCNDKYYLSDSGDCIQNTDQHCEIYKTNTKECLQCLPNNSNTKYYVDSSNVCQLASNIQNCVYFNTKETCKTCSPGTALSVDQKLCLPSAVVDENCNVQVRSSEETCAVCNAGYQFDEEMVNCVAYDGNSSFSKGCFLAHLTDETKCQMCMIGYYMDNNFACINENPEVELPTSVVMMKITLLFLGLFI